MAGSSWHRLLVVVDQFEELFTLCADRGEQQVFLDLLVQVTSQRNESQSPLTVVVAMRADFLNRALEHRGFADALRGAMDPLGPMTRDQLRAAIEKPAKMRSVEFAEGLVERILDDVGHSAGRLPLLEFVLTLLWEHQEGQRLSHDSYDRLGKVQGALARHAEKVYRSLPPADQDRTRRVFGQLVRLGEATEDTRRVAARAELAAEEWALVSHLAGKRLLVTDRDPAGEETVQVAHEALIREWGRLRGWLAADRAFLAWLERMRGAVSLWEVNNRDEGALLRGGLLDEAERWSKERPGQVAPGIKAFVNQSRAERAQDLILRGKAAGAPAQATANYRKALTIAREIGDEALQLEMLDSLISASPTLAGAIDLWPAHWALKPPRTSTWSSRARSAFHLVRLLRGEAAAGLFLSLCAWGLAVWIFASGFSPMVVAVAVGATTLVLRTYCIGARVFIALPLAFLTFLVLATIFTISSLAWSAGIALGLALLLFISYRWRQPEVLRPVRPFLEVIVHPLSYRRIPAVISFDDPTSVPDGDT